MKPHDMRLHPVWEFVQSEEFEDETNVLPVDSLPVGNLDNRIVGTKVRLANGDIVWAMLGNIDLADPERNEQFRTLSIFNNGRWVSLARYHDYDYDDRGPAAFSRSMGLSVEDVFPIVYDIRHCCVGNESVVVDAFEAEPKRKLTRDELISLSLP